MLFVSRGGRGDEGKDLEREIDGGSARRTCFLSAGRDEFAPSRNVIFSPHMCFF